MSYYSDLDLQLQEIKAIMNELDGPEQPEQPEERSRIHIERTAESCLNELDELICAAKSDHKKFIPERMVWKILVRAQLLASAFDADKPRQSTPKLRIVG